MFRPRFYQEHKEQVHFEPWTYRVCKDSIVGYCSWWPYRNGISQQVVDELADVFAEKRLPDFGKQHPNWFVTKQDGTIYQGSYGIWTLNTANKEAVDNMVRPLFRELKKQGWDYVKIDGAGDMLYSDKQQPAAEHFKKVGITPEESLRKWDRVARDELGRDIFIPTCWGVGPGRVSVGLVDGVRLGSDKAEVYKQDAHLEGMKRSAPVLFTVPGQLHNNVGNGACWLQEIDRPFDHWSVPARFNWDGKGAPEQEVKFADLGLDPNREYLVFEFWTQNYLGKPRGSFTAAAMDENNGMQVFAIREAHEHPWVLSTTRHISQGGVSLLDEQWDASG